MQQSNNNMHDKLKSYKHIKDGTICAKKNLPKIPG